MISSDKLNLKITKMELQKILDIFEEHGFNENNCSFFRQEDITDIAKELKQAINYTRCCDKLKTKEIPTFKEWLKHFKNSGNYYLFSKEKLYSEKEMLNIYNNLPDY